MSRAQPVEDVPGARRVAVGAQAAYDAVARHYDRQLADELDGKPLDRALLQAFLELVGAGTIADVGCGPGHVTRFLAARHPEVLGIDLSPRMIEIARERSPTLAFDVGSMLQLPVADGAWAGAAALYSIIHLTPDERETAFRELARAVRPGGWLLVSFHIDSDEFAPGEVNHLTSWFGEAVELDGSFLDPVDVVAELESAAFELVAKMERQPSPDVEYPSRRCYLLARRRDPASARGHASQTHSSPVPGTTSPPTSTADPGVASSSRSSTAAAPHICMS